MRSVNGFTPVSCATVTAATAASSITVPATVAGKNHCLLIQVSTNAAAFSLSGTAEAPDGTPDSKALTYITGAREYIEVGPSTTAISFIRVGSSDAVVYLTWGYTH